MNSFEIDNQSFLVAKLLYNSLCPSVCPYITLGRFVDLGSSELDETLYKYSVDEYKHFLFNEL